SDAPDTADPAVPRRRLQLPAPGPVRRARVPVAAHDPAVTSWGRLLGWRVRDDREPAGPPARRRGAAGPGRCGDLRRQPATDSRPARRRASRGDAPWGQSGALGPSAHGRADLPRRAVTANGGRRSFDERMALPLRSVQTKERTMKMLLSELTSPMGDLLLA